MLQKRPEGPIPPPPGQSWLKHFTKLYFYHVQLIPQADAMTTIKGRHVASFHVK